MTLKTGGKMYLQEQIRGQIMSLGHNLKVIREEKSLTQKHLSDISNVSSTQISKIERGDAKNPELDTIKKLCFALGVSSDSLIFDENERDPAFEMIMLFEATQKLKPEQHETMKEVISALLMKFNAEDLMKS